ncbi:MAG: PKD domain-containing protein [Planctomycetes bacterium]|nr:PKD domain-containing protein [Planctomycetota bacterium]
MYDVPAADGSAGVDVAAVRVWHGGSASASGNDYRVFDVQGRPVPYELAYHHPSRDSLLLVRCDAPGKGGLLCVYWGKADAGVDPVRALLPAAGGDGLATGPPQPGPGAGGWVPRAGLVLTTMRRPPAPTNPETPAEMMALIAGSPGLDGAGLRTNISDGFNRWGDTDNFISVYRGWMRVPATGSYAFCTASNEASFSYLDGKELIHWPGRHTEARGKYGEVNATRRVAAGMRYVEYYHENPAMQSMAFLGYRPPGGKAFVGIPDDWFPRPHMARQRRAESADGKRSLAARMEILDSRWPEGRAAQHTRLRFTADAGADAMDLTAWKIEWSAGDGLSETGASAEHVYLVNGDYRVTMTATGPAGERVERVWPISVFRIDRAGWLGNGDQAAYAAIVKRYDPARLAPAQAAELARLRLEAGDRDGARAAAVSVTTRSNASAEDLAAMHLLLAGLDAPGRTPAAKNETQKNPAIAAGVAEHLKQAIDKQTDPIARVEAMSELIRVMALDQGDTAGATGWFDRAASEAGKTAGSRRAKKAMRSAAIALGDRCLFTHEPGGAAEWYGKAEAMADPVIPPQVRMTKSGAYPESIDQAIAQGRLADAAALVERWLDDLPSDQLKGAVLFYRGKVDALRGDAGSAIGPLQLAVEFGQGAEFEAEARWLLAEAYRNTGDAENRWRALEALIRSGLDSPYRTRAIEAMKEKPK